VRRYTSCQQISSDVNILLVPCGYISETIYHIELEQHFEIPNHNTQQNLNCLVQFCRTIAFKKGVMSMGVKLYSKLLNKSSEMENTRQFKREMRCTHYNIYFTL
jgi:hypothetical protein